VKNLNSIFIIPARKGSKGIPNKNIKKLFGTPLIKYTTDFAKKIKTSNDIICITTNDQRVKNIIKNDNEIEIINRPNNISLDSTSMQDVIDHVIEFYDYKNISFNSIVLLQPSSPIRKISDFKKIKKEFNINVDMVVSVKKAKENPYYLLYEENNKGFLEKSKPLKVTRRQDAPEVYCLNGSFFMINNISLKNKLINDFSKIIKVEMPFERSIDLDDKLDWDFLNFLILNKNLLP
tara:strand:- start:303 stop:1007 length:705 start_codon:yes stop_codon:yes gene_type:complete